MSKFTPITDLKLLLNELYKGRDLLTDLFENRKAARFSLELALKSAHTNEDTIEHLRKLNIIHINGNYLEINDLYSEFFEEALGTNEEINVELIQKTVSEIKKYILYHRETTLVAEKLKYLNKVKAALRKIQRIISKSIEDLNRNINNTFKTEPDFKVKKLKLEDYAQKRIEIIQLMEDTETLIEKKELIFFRTETDIELNHIKIDLLLLFRQAANDLIHINTQILEYLNQVESRSFFLSKLHQLTYLIEQHEIKNESKSNFMTLITQNQDIIHQPKPIYALKLSLNQLQEDDAYKLIQQIVNNANQPSLPKKQVKSGGGCSKAEQEAEFVENEQVNLFELHQNFISNKSTTDLFNFILNYNFTRLIPLGTRLTIYCQMISFFNNDYRIEERYSEYENIEYAIVYSK
jgi:hypothetical protein